MASKSTKPKGNKPKSTPKKSATSEAKKQVRDAAKAAANKALLNTAANLTGAGDAKVFMENVQVIRNERAVRRASTKREKAARVAIKSMKLSLRDLTEFLKQLEMEPEERESYVVGVAHMKEMAQLPLLPVEQNAIDGLKERREEARNTMLGISGGDSGKEVGSANGIGHNSNGTEGAPAPAPQLAANDEEEQEQAPSVPAVNESLSAGVH